MSPIEQSETKNDAKFVIDLDINSAIQYSIESVVSPVIKQNWFQMIMELNRSYEKIQVFPCSYFRISILRFHL